ncbi:MAG: acetate/propionate family kinase [Afipia sp.]
MADVILTINVGSSSIKFALFENEFGDVPPVMIRGAILAVESDPHLIARDNSGHILAEKRWGRGTAFDMLLNDFIAWIESRLGGGRLAGVGHRIVHGGGCHMQPEKVGTKLLDALDRLSGLAPLHEASSVAPMRVIGRLRPNLPQVACFDTAFHRTMPSVATRFGLPRELEDAGIRRYGFHGLSYEYIAGRLCEIAPELGGGRIIAAHLGNGASLCAMRAGQSVDTTMGFTPLDGLVMGTRCGNLDPGVILFLEQERGMMASQVEDMLYRRSGLLGVSGGIASDMPTLLASEDAHAVQAVELFVYRIARDVGALTSSLGGLDGIVFTAGIGENASSIREAICARLAWLGVELDAQANEAHAPLISSSRSKVAVRVIPTDEETVIARHTMKVIGL